MTEYRTEKLIYCNHTDCPLWEIHAIRSECVISCQSQDWKYIMVQIPVETKTMVIR